METLAQAVTVFLISALAVILAGVGLARFGDELAEKTGWGALWVGTVLVSIATSLPELTVNISAVWLEDSPGLALGNVFGANMINVFVMASVALIFGGRNIFSGQGRDTEVLILVGVGLVILAAGVAATGDLKLGPTSVGGVLILLGYLAGMRMVYDTGRADAGEEADESGRGNARNAWIGFIGCALVVIVAGRYLAQSADRIAEVTGIGASFIGVLLVSIVTTLPEGSVTVAATLRKSYGIVVGNVYGSCAFNVAVIFFADLFSSGRPLLGQMEAAHAVAAAGAIVLMSMGFAILKGYTSHHWRWARGLTLVVPVLYVAVLYGVFELARR
jgi:cation:H+ antiporter